MTLRPLSIAQVDPWVTVRSFMHRTCGVIFGDDQRYLLDSRLGPLARAHGFADVASMVEIACAATSSSPYCTAIVDALTTHETFFFRDLPFWKAIEQVVLPRLFEGGARPLKIWSAACSTGQEPYSLAMLLQEKWPAVAARCEIVATDISEPALERARKGLFTSLEVNRGLGAARLLDHFEAAPGGFLVKKHFRDRIRWSTYNLVGAAEAPSGCDVVLCRNVLIYFNEQGRRMAQGRIVRATAQHGFLGVGSTELMQVAHPIVPGWYEGRVIRAATSERG
jgi:chemotaxis protein methyltransferase CheR